MRSHLSPIKTQVLILLLCCSCVSVPYLDKHQYQGKVKELTEEKYDVSHGDTILLEKRYSRFTKNGREKYGQIFDANGKVTVTKEKKLWFVKQSFPDKESYYCKTRWKTHNRERISCYTQKQYKQNQAIAYYHDDGSIDKIEEDFSTFDTQFYHYNAQHELIAVSIKDKNGVLLDSIQFKCKLKDQLGNCIKLEQRYLVSDSIVMIHRLIEY